MVSSEISRSDLSEPILFWNLEIVFIYMNKFKVKNLDFLEIFFESLPKYSDFVKFDDGIGNISSRYIKSNPNLIGKLFFYLWKWISLAPCKGIVKVSNV